MSNDAGTAMGAAMLFYYSLTQTKEKKVDEPTLYLGPKRTYTTEQIEKICSQPGVELVDATNEEVVKINFLLPVLSDGGRNHRHDFIFIFSSGFVLGILSLFVCPIGFVIYNKFLPRYWVHFLEPHLLVNLFNLSV